jgi:UDP-N-acetyl-D-mannosaminuronate dehydrogenase
VPLRYDPLLDIAEAEAEFRVKMLTGLSTKIKFDAVILAVIHDIFRNKARSITLENLAGIMNSHPVLVDIHRFFEGSQAKKAGFCYRTL